MKNIKVLLVSLLAILSLCVVFIRVLDNRENLIENSDAVKFEKEYESLNGIKTGNNEYLELDISSDNPMIYAKYDDIEQMINSGTGVIYFGFPECPWCRNVVPQLISVADEAGLDKIYYFNALEIRDVKSIDENGDVVVEKEGTEEYNKLIELLYDYLGEYEGLNDETIKRLYFPTVVFVKDGQIIGSHIGTLDSQTNPYIPLTESQSTELKDIYSEYMLEVLDIICDTDVKDKC